MRQRWWIAIVAVVGIGLAILLFPRPDTGEAIEGTDPASQAVAEGKAPRPRAPADPNRERPGVRPGMEEVAAKRNRPEAIYASKLVTPFSSIRYTLVKEGSEPAKALAEEISGTMAELRTVRLDPDAQAWDDLQAKTDAMIAKVKASPFATNEQITRSLKRYDDFVAEYHKAIEAGGATVPSTPPPGTIDQEE
jgi:hypothetical protein